LLAHDQVPMSSAAERRLSYHGIATNQEQLMTTHEFKPVEVSRRIEADAATIFGVIADPRRHIDMDGSDMVRGSLTDAVVAGVGDVFVLKTYYSEHGDYLMANRVVEYEPNRRIVWEPRRIDIEEPAWGHRWGYELVPDGEGATIVTEIYDCSRTPEDERADIQDGKIWIGAMTNTLERLDKLCTARQDTRVGLPPPEV
jgi:hypothetical protein